MRVLTLVIVFLVSAATSFASDWPQWFGPNHDGISDEKISPWTAGGPKQVWKVPVGEGLGTPTVVGNKVYFLMAQTKAGAAPAANPGAGGGRNRTPAGKGGEESVLCIDATNGKQLWAAPVGPTILGERQGNDGPRSTPAISDGKIYALGTYLNLACVDMDGKPVWTHDSEKEFGAGPQLNGDGIRQWGAASSPVVDGNLVFALCGAPDKALMAFDKKTGKVAWQVENEYLTHTTPTVATILGQRQVIFFSKSGLVSVVPENGKVLWRYKFPWKTSTAISPVVCGPDLVYCGAGYGVGGSVCKITKEGDAFKAAEVWFTAGKKGSPDDVMAHWTTPVFKDGHLYGIFSAGQPKDAPAKCVDVMTGKVKWHKDGFGQGGVTLVDGRPLFLTADGELVLLEANPNEYKELARAKVLNYKCWNQPVVSGGKIYARSNNELVCVEAK